MNNENKILICDRNKIKCDNDTGFLEGTISLFFNCWIDHNKIIKGLFRVRICNTKLKIEETNLYHILRLNGSNQKIDVKENK